MLSRILWSEESLNGTLKIQSSYIKSALELAVPILLLASLTIVQAEQSKSILSPQELKQLAPIIEAAEKSIFNLKIESELWVETKVSLSDPCERWQRTPIYVASTAWLEGNPFDQDPNRGKVKVDVDREVLEWKEGAAPFSESSYSMGFDGQYGRIAYHTSGPMTKTFPIKKGRILPDTPKRLRSGWCDRFTGARFSLNFLFSGREDTLSNRFRWASDPNSLAASCFEFTPGEEFAGVECIKIATRGVKGWQENYWIDPSRGFALIGHKSTSILEDGSEQVISSMKVSKLKEVADGIWWPTEASIILRPYASGRPYQRFVYRASNIVANDPNFDDDVFTVPFPNGYLIDDKVTGKK